MKENEILTRDLLNAQTGRVPWAELARYFAQGRVVCVADSQDLLAVADAMVGDEVGAIERLHASGCLRRAQDDDARRWSQRDTEFWAVVVAPWVLVQELEPQPSGDCRENLS